MIAPNRWTLRLPPKRTRLRAAAGRHASSLAGKAPARFDSVS